MFADMQLQSGDFHMELWNTLTQRFRRYKMFDPWHTSPGGEPYI